MPFSIYSLLLAAEQDRMQDLFRAFRAAQAREGIGQIFYGLLVCTAVVAAVLFLVQLIRSRRRQTVVRAPGACSRNCAAPTS